MKIDDFLQLFVVKEKKFFQLFNEQGFNLVKAAELLRKFIREENQEIRAELYKKIKTVETDNDTITSNIYEELNRSFVTPFDREDIHDLASWVDSVVDSINSASKRTVLYAPVNTEGMAPLTETILEQAKEVQKALSGLKNVRKNPEFILSCCENLRRLENKGDLHYEEYILHLFKNQTDPIRVIKGKSVVEELENVTDRGKDVAAVLHRIIMKLT